MSLQENLKILLVTEFLVGILYLVFTVLSIIFDGEPIPHRFLLIGLIWGAVVIEFSIFMSYLLNNILAS